MSPPRPPRRRLTARALAILLPLLLALPAPALAAAGKKSEADADAAEAAAYRLTTPTFEKVSKAYRTFGTEIASNPALRERLAGTEFGPDEDDAEMPTLREIVARLESVPEFKKAIAGAGLKTREFVLFGFTLAGTALAASFVESGQPLAADAPPSLAANVRWYGANQDAVTRFFLEMERLFPDDEDDEEDLDGPDDEDWTDAEMDSSAVFEE